MITDFSGCTEQEKTVQKSVAKDYEVEHVSKLIYSAWRKKARRREKRENNKLESENTVQKNIIKDYKGKYVIKLINMKKRL